MSELKVLGIKFNQSNNLIIEISYQMVDSASKKNIEEQLDRLLSQLNDLEEAKEELSAEEYK